MRKVAADDPLPQPALPAGAETFINKGTNGRWRDVLSKADRKSAI